MNSEPSRNALSVQPLRSLLLTALLAFGLAGAQAGPGQQGQRGQQGSLASFLASLEAYPGLQAARTSLALAEARLAQAYDPFGVSLNSTFDPQPPVDDPTFTASAGAVFRPFLYGENADTVRLRQVELAQAQLNYNEALSALEVEALEAAWSVQLAEESLRLAQEGIAVAERSLTSTQARLERGVASPPELRSAQLGLSGAQNLRADSEDALALAQLRLATFVGETRLSALPEYPLPGEGVPLAVARAQNEVALQQVDIGGLQRNLYPVVEATYAQGIGERNAVFASINTASLAPSVGYSYTSDGADTGFRLNVSYNISLNDFSAVGIAEGEVEQNELALQDVTQRAQLERTGLINALESTRRNLDLARRAFESARQTLEETQAREELGLSLPLETQQAAVAVTEAGQQFQAARLGVQAARFDLYAFYGLPPSSVRANLTSIEIGPEQP